MGYGAKDLQAKLKFPSGFEDPESEQGKRIRSKGVIYEVKLHSWIERVDLDGNEGSGKFLKQFVRKAENKEWEKPEGIDEIKINVRAYAGSDQTLFEKKEWDLKLNDPSLPSTFSQIISSMKRGELSLTEISPLAYSLDNQLLSETIPSLAELNNIPALNLEIELLCLIKVTDWFKETDSGTAIKRVLRKGKSGQPNSESIVKSKD